MSLEEITRRTIDGASIGKLLLTTAIGALMTITGATLHTVYVEHSRQLAGISQQLTDLVEVEDQRAKTTDSAIAKLADAEQQHTTAIALAEHEIEALKNDRSEPSPRHYEAAPQPPPIVAPLVNAFSHIFTPPRAHHRRP